MRQTTPRQPRPRSSRWEVIRYALTSNARTIRLCAIWVVMTGATATALSLLIRELISHVLTHLP
jgi:hypothetical protein